MRYRTLSETGDYVLGRPVAAEFYIDNPEAVAQAVKTRLELLRGEWFLDDTVGTPYSTEILGKNTRATHDLAIREQILGTQGVLSIVDYVSSVNAVTRALSVTATIDTIYGQTTIQQVL